MYILNTLTTGRWLLDNVAALGSGGSELCLMGVVVDAAAVEVLLWLWWKECCGWWTVELVTEVGSVTLEKLPQLKGKKIIRF